jgi:uncharacterized protein (DUF2236 family)
MRFPREELHRLRTACGRRRIDSVAGLFGPHTVTWRIDREAAVLLGGGRALLLQIAHPLVAAAIAAHSRFRERPLERLWRTVDLILTIVFADAETGLAAVGEIERAHARVEGVLGMPVGRLAAGTRYAARDPALALWVHATLVESALVAYERFVGPLRPHERAAYWEQSKTIARLLGVPDAMLPRTFAAFRRYVATMIAGDELTVGQDAREAAAAILRPPVPLGVAELFRLTRFVTVGLLPPVVRARYGLAWDAAHEAGLSALAAASRHIVPLLPPCVRFVPHARSAGARLRSRPASPH